MVVISRCQRFVMSMFRQCRRVHTLHETLEFPGSKRFPNPLEFARAKQRGSGHCLPTCRHCPPSSVTRVIMHMNTKMILAAVALSLSLAACAKKEEPAEAAQDAAATASDAAGRLRTLLVTLLPPRVMPLLPLATPLPLPRPRRLRLRASSRPSRSSNRPVSVIVPISTDDCRSQDTGRDSPPGILAAEPPSEVSRDSQHPRRAELSAGPHLDPGAVPGISRRPFAARA